MHSSFFLLFAMSVTVLVNGQNFGHKLVLMSPAVAPFGTWEKWQDCPEGTFVTGFDSGSHELLRGDATIGSVIDHLGLVSIVLECSRPRSNVPERFLFSEVRGVLNILTNGTTVIEDSVDDRNLVEIKYTYPLNNYCRGVATGFQLMTQNEQIAVDNVATTNMRLYCSELKDNSPQYIEGYGESQGEWTEEQNCRERQAICGLLTQSVIFEHTNYDNTGINNIRIKCCDLPNPASTCVPYDVWELVQECDNSLSDMGFACSFLRRVGVTTTKNQSFVEDYDFNENNGYSMLTHQFWLYEALATNFATNMGISAETNYDWSHVSDEVFDEPVPELVEFQATYRMRLRIYQAVGKCSYFSARAAMFKMVTDEGTMAEKTEHFKLTTKK